MELTTKFKKFLTIDNRKLAKFIRSFKRTIIVFIIISFGILLGISMALPLSDFSRIITLCIFFIIILYYNYLLDEQT